MLQCSFDFLLLLFDGAIFRDEDQLARLTNRFFCTPAKDAFRAGAPINDIVRRAKQENGVVTCSIHQQPVPFFALA